MWFSRPSVNGSWSFVTVSSCKDRLPKVDSASGASEGRTGTAFEWLREKLSKIALINVNESMADNTGSVKMSLKNDCPAEFLPFYIPVVRCLIRTVAIGSQFPSNSLSCSVWNYKQFCPSDDVTEKQHVSLLEFWRLQTLFESDSLLLPASGNGVFTRPLTRTKTDFALAQCFFHTSRYRSTHCSWSTGLVWSWSILTLGRCSEDRWPQFNPFSKENSLAVGYVTENWRLPKSIWPFSLADRHLLPRGVTPLRRVIIYNYINVLRCG